MQFSDGLVSAFLPLFYGIPFKKVATNLAIFKWQFQRTFGTMKNLREWPIRSCLSTRLFPFPKLLAQKSIWYSFVLANSAYALGLLYLWLVMFCHHFTSVLILFQFCTLQFMQFQWPAPFFAPFFAVFFLAFLPFSYLCFLPLLLLLCLTALQLLLFCFLLLGVCFLFALVYAAIFIINANVSCRCFSRNFQLTTRGHLTTFPKESICLRLLSLMRHSGRKKVAI